MTTYYKGLLGDRTYIRASTRSGYQSMVEDRNGSAGFSSKPATSPANAVTAIGKVEYDFLLSLKKARTDSSAPSDSWVWTKDATAPYDEPAPDAIAIEPEVGAEMVAVAEAAKEREGVDAAWKAATALFGPEMGPVETTPVLHQYSPLAAADAKAAEKAKPAKRKRETRQDARNAVRKTVAAAAKSGAKKADLGLIGAVAAQEAAKPKAEKPAKGPTVKERIWAMMQRPNGASEKEVCAELGWTAAGATIGRVIKAATSPVRKERGEDGRTRYIAG